MKKIIAVCLCMVICFMFTACGDESEVDVPMGMQLASNESVPDYILMVPSDWVVEESTGTTTAYYKDNMSSAVLATFTASFSVPETADVTLDNYFDSFSDEFAQVFGDSQADMEVSSTTLGGEDAKQYIYTAKFGDIEYKFWQVFCLHEGRMYTLTYSTRAEYFEKFAEDMEVILEYFSFKE